MTVSMSTLHSYKCPCTTSSVTALLQVSMLTPLFTHMLKVFFHLHLVHNSSSSRGEVASTSFHPPCAIIMATQNNTLRAASFICSLCFLSSMSLHCSSNCCSCRSSCFCCSLYTLCNSAVMTPNWVCNSLAISQPWV